MWQHRDPCWMLAFYLQSNLSFITKIYKPVLLIWNCEVMNPNQQDVLYLFHLSQYHDQHGQMLPCLQHPVWFGKWKSYWTESQIKGWHGSIVYERKKKKRKLRNWTHPGESVDISSLMATCQPSLIALSVGSYVFLVAQTKLLDGLLDHGKPSIISHRLGAEGKN